MQIATAIKVIQKESEFLGMGFLETMQFIQKSPLAQPQKTMEAYRAIVENGSKMFAPVDA
jgi:hypothetical protein